MSVGELLLACLDTSDVTSVLLYDGLGDWEDDVTFDSGSVAYVSRCWGSYRVKCFSCEYFPDGGVKVFHVCVRR